LSRGWQVGFVFAALEAAGRDLGEPAGRYTTAASYLSEPGVTWMSGGTKRQTDNAPDPCLRRARRLGRGALQMLSSVSSGRKLAQGEYEVGLGQFSAV
jgi:hypothetical protein